MTQITTLFVPDERAARIVRNLNFDLIDVTVDSDAEMGDAEQDGQRFRFDYGHTISGFYDEGGEQANCALEVLWKEGYWNK